MIERIREIWIESNWILSEIIGYNFEIEMALSRLASTLDDLEASSEPTNSQIEIVFIALNELKNSLGKCIIQVPKSYQPLIENLIDRIEIFLFHHRMF
mgnify:CR=1 FL=1|jgi:hypothetical protein